MSSFRTDVWINVALFSKQSPVPPYTDTSDPELDSCWAPTSAGLSFQAVAPMRVTHAFQPQTLTRPMCDD